MAHTPPEDEGATSTALGVSDAVSISLATGLGGAVLAASARAALPLEQALSWIWTALAWVSVLTVAVAWRVGGGSAVPEGDAPALALD
jgi:hypothetical protein